jgi:hypothetical protein
MRILFKLNRLYHTGILAPAAAYALVNIKQYAAPLALSERVGRADFRAGRIGARMANRGDKLPRQPSACAHVDTAFFNRVILPVQSGTNQHTRKTPDTFVHLIRF